MKILTKDLSAMQRDIIKYALVTPLEWNHPLVQNLVAPAARYLITTNHCKQVAMTHYAFPGRYNIYYTMCDGSKLCAWCASKLLQRLVKSLEEQINAMLQKETIDDTEDLDDYVSPYELIVGGQSVADTDDEIVCADCNFQICVKDREIDGA